MRDPTALHVGLEVLTPDGPAVIRARRGGPITTWLASDHWWRESQIAVPEPDEPTPSPEHVCVGCGRSSRPLSTTGGTHCHGTGGLVINGTPVPCGCRCGTRWRDELDPERMWNGS